MKRIFAITSNSRPGVRSDCEITLELKGKGGTIFDLNSKVETLYGESIKDLCKGILHFFNIRNALRQVDFRGAERICGKPQRSQFEDKVVAAIKWVDGTVIDVVRKIRHRN